MRIDNVKVKKYGPLENINWNPADVSVLYDDNMVGKTALVDLIIKYVFTPRKRSTTFGHFERFDGENPQITVDVSSEESSFKFGPGEEAPSLSELLDWEEEELFRFLCIRSGDADLVSKENKRTSMFDALAALVSGVEGGKLKEIIRDVKRRCLITSKSYKWLNRKNTHPPYLRDKIYDEILPFLENFEELQAKLNDLERLRAEKSELEEKRNDLESKLNDLEEKKDFLETAQLKREVNDLLQYEQKLGSFNRYKEGSEKKWKEELSKKERSERALLGSEDSQDPGLKKKLEKLKRKKDETEKRIEKELPQEIRKLESDIRSLDKEKKEIEEESEAKRKKAIKFIEEEVNDKLKKAADLQEYLENTWSWGENKTLFYLLSSSSILLGVFLGVMIWPYSFSLVPIGALLLASAFFVNKRRRNKSARLKELKRRTLSRFEEEYGNYIAEDLGDLHSLRSMKNEIPLKVEESFKRKRELEEVKSQIVRLKEDLKEKKQEKEKLSESLEDIEAQAEEIREKVEKQEKNLKEAKQRLEELRDKTGLSDIKDLRDKLEVKREIENKIDKGKEIVGKQLGGNEMETSDIQLALEEKMEKLPPSKRRELDEKSKSELKDLDFQEKRKEVEKEKKEKKARKERIDEEIKGKKERIEEIKLELRSNYQVDPSNIEEIYSKRKEYSSNLKRYIRERIAGYCAAEILKSIRGDFVKTLESFLNKKSDKRSNISDLFSNVMGTDLELNFDHKSREFFIVKDDRSFREADLSSGARRHLFYSVRLGLLNQITPAPAFLVLDDPFLVYHKERKRRAIAQLKKLIEKGWQVVSMTVDSQTRDFMVDELGAREYRMENLET